MKARDRIEAIRRRARKQELLILVWGPGDPGADASGERLKYWEKRVQIRESIQSAYPESEVLFSESDALRDHTRDLNDLLAEELVHATAADCILILDVSRGAHVEIDRFSDIPQIAAKTTVLLPERFVGNSGLVGEVHKKVRIMGFSETEFEECNLATSKSISAVDVYALSRLIQSNLPTHLL